MFHIHRRSSRRDFLAASTLATAFFHSRGLFADELTKTPAQTEGPFYPIKLPLDTDNDLLVINETITPAVGEITHLTGRILDTHGQPIKNAVVEIWQVDNNGAYLHGEDPNHEKLDKNFQGFGRFATGANAEYYFRTIKPVVYPGRCPHIHVKIKKAGKELLTTQCYVKDHPANNRDGIYRSLTDPKQRDAVTIEFLPITQSKIGELAARFDIVLGGTPEL
jgi:protocatechuate 3,4-dioxygenase beta subunit